MCSYWIGKLDTTKKRKWIVYITNWSRAQLPVSVSWHLCPWWESSFRQATELLQPDMVWSMLIFRPLVSWRAYKQVWYHWWVLRWSSIWVLNCFVFIICIIIPRTLNNRSHPLHWTMQTRISKYDLKLGPWCNTTIPKINYINYIIHASDLKNKTINIISSRRSGDL